MVELNQRSYALNVLAYRAVGFFLLQRTPLDFFTDGSSTYFFPLSLVKSKSVECTAVEANPHSRVALPVSARHIFL